MKIGRPGELKVAVQACAGGVIEVKDPEREANKLPSLSIQRLIRLGERVSVSFVVARITVGDAMSVGVEIVNIFEESLASGDRWRLSMCGLGADADASPHMSQQQILKKVSVLNVCEKFFTAI